MGRIIIRPFGGKGISGFIGAGEIRLRGIKGIGG